MIIENKEQLQRLLPRNKKHLANDSVLALLRDPLDSSNIQEFISDNFINYTDLLKDSTTYGLKDYINAVKFASHRMLGSTWLECYKKTFPDRYDEHLAEGKTLDALRARADGFSRTKLVQSILERGYIAPYLLNQPLFQEALNTAAKIMLDDSVGAMARVNAAKTVLEYTKAPEVQKLQMEVGIKASDELSQLEDTMNKLADVVYTGIQSGKLTSKEAIESRIIEVEAEDYE